MDILQIKKLVSQWQKKIEKDDNYLVIKTINEIINTYKTLNEKEKNNLLENIKPLQRKIFNFMYSNDPFVRRNVINFAYLMGNNELVNDVIKYLKVEKDYDNLQIYLKYIKKFGSVGFIPDILEFAKQVSVSKIKYEAFSLILSLASSYKDYEKITDFIFNDFRYLIGNTKSFFLLNDIYRELIDISLVYFRKQNKPKVASFFYGFYNYIFIKTMELVSLLKERFVHEEAYELAVSIFTFLLVDYHILEVGDYYSLNKEKDNSKYKEDQKEERVLYRNFSLADIFISILSYVKKVDLFLLNIMNVLDTLSLKEQFKKYVVNDKLIDYFLSLLEKVNEKYALRILYFFNYLEVKFDEVSLVKLEEYSKKVLNEGIIDICVEIFEKNRYYHPVFYFLKYSVAYSNNLKNKLKNVIKKIAKVNE